jgi:hypothetical protein
MSAEESVAAAIVTIKAAKDEAAKHVKDAVREAVKAVFASDDKVTAIRWRQYTPYFNDGDACVFGLHGVEASVGGDDGGGGEDGFFDDYSLKSGGKYGSPDLPHVGEALGELEGKLGEWEELLQTAFGDHAEVTIERAGAVIIDEYNHD